MSMAFSYIAARTTPELLMTALPEVWPDYEIVDKSAELGTFDDLYEWCDARSEYLSGTSPFDARGLYGFADWAVIIDFSMLLAGDREQMIELSSRFGEVVAIATQGTAGIASFSYLKNGTVERVISSTDGSVESEGQPLEAESQMDISNFYVQEIEGLWQSFGLPPFPGPDEGSFVGIHVKDNTDFGGLL